MSESSEDLVAKWRRELDTTGPADWQFTTANTTEAFPGVVSPLTWSLLEPDCREGTCRTMIRLGLREDVDPRPSTALGYTAGRVTANLTESQNNFGKMPGAGATAVKSAMYGEHRLHDVEAGPAAAEEASGAEIMRRFAAEAQKLGEDLPRTREAVLAGVAAGFGDDIGVFDRAAPMFDLVWEQHTMTTILASVAEGSMAATAAQAVDAPEDAAELTAMLASAGHEVVSGGPGRRLAEIARLLRETGEHKALDPRDPARSLEALPADVRGALDTFVADYGHRGPAEMDLARPSWGSDPTLLVPMLAALAKSETAATPGARRDVVAEIRERFGTDVADVMAPHVENAVGMLAAREQSKDLVCRVCNAARRSLNALGRNLADRGAIQEPGDVFLLTEQEVRALWDGEDLAEKAARRRRTVPLLEQGRLPMVFALPGELTLEGTPVAGSGSDVLRGEGIVAGVVRGRARVLSDPSEAYDLEPGDILVARTTDTAWTPLFLVASAVVTQVGAAVSHAAIVAREFGVPTVVGVAGLMSRVSSGDTITVDGRKGTVEVEPAGR